MTNRKKHNRFLAELLFWFHTAVMLAILFSGLFVPLWGVILIIVIVGLQQYLLHGCFITLLEVKTGGLPKGHVYMQLAIQRFLRIKLTRRRGVRIAVISHIVLTILISLLATHYDYQVQL